MMRVIVGSFGVVLGLLAGFALVFANPLFLMNRVQPLAHGDLLRTSYHAGSSAGIESAVLRMLGIGPAFERDPANRNVRIRAQLLPVEGASLPVLAVRVSTVADQNSFWRAHLGMLDYWLLSRPGEGSLFAAGYSNFWAVARDLAWSTLRGRNRAGLAASYDLSALPPKGHMSGVAGARGSFSEVAGEVRTDLAADSSIGATWGLTLRLDRPDR